MKCYLLCFPISSSLAKFFWSFNILKMLTNFIPLWEWTWCHYLFSVTQNWNTCDVVRVQENMHMTTKRCSWNACTLVKIIIYFLLHRTETCVMLSGCSKICTWQQKGCGWNASTLVKCLDIMSILKVGHSL